MGYKSPIVCLDINQTGVNIPTSGTSASSSIPNCSNGLVAKYVRVSCTANAHVRVGKGTATAVATDTLVMPGESLILNVTGADTIAAIQDSAAGTVNVVPIEWA
jgi:hypothetical protein